MIKTVFCEGGERLDSFHCHISITLRFKTRGAIQFRTLCDNNPPPQVYNMEGLPSVVSHKQYYSLNFMLTNIVFCHCNCTMKYEISISSSFPFNKPSFHFIFGRRLDLNYFDFSWTTLSGCY